MNPASQLRPRRRRRSAALLSVLGVLTVLLAACSRSSTIGGSGTGTTGTAAPQAGQATAATFAAARNCTWSACGPVLAAVRSAETLNKVPADLTPSLAAAPHDILPPSGDAGCVAGASATSTPFPCLTNKSGRKRLVLIGDSHALMWATALADLARRHGYELLFLAKIPCPLPLVPMWDQINQREDTSCLSWKRWAIRRVDAFRPQVVVAATEDYVPYTGQDRPMSQAAFSSGLAATLEALSKPGRKVYLIGDIPYLASAPPVCLAAHQTSVQDCSTPAQQAVLAANQQAEKAAALRAKAIFLDTVPWLCTVNVCPPVIGHYEVYQGQFHITSTFARSLEPVLGEALGLG